MTDRPAILGGPPAFDPPLPFAQPTLENKEKVEELIAASLESGWLTDGPLTRRLEERVGEQFGVEHCIAVSSCTTGLLFVIQALGLDGVVALPSFTFTATAHAVRWNALQPQFLDCDPATWCVGPDEIAGEPDALIGVHVSGVPCDVEGLERSASQRGIPLIFDAAHGAGSSVQGPMGSRPLGGSGLAEVFSLTPTKVLSGAEGGLVTTNDAALAEHVRLAKNYGNPGDYNTIFPGLNGRLSELHAALALVALDHLEDRVEHRNRVAARYREILQDVPGVAWQLVSPGDRSSFKDFTILIDETAFGCSRDDVVAALAAEGINTRKYYSPPVHRQQAYADVDTPILPVTDRLGDQVVSLPIWSHLPLEDVERVAGAIVQIQVHAGSIAAIEAG
jgi:dTDP-4-amino-4,6-dideoxygalactose transaminase